jgi:hypothetical protein
MPINKKELTKEQIMKAVQCKTAGTAGCSFGVKLMQALGL